MTNLFKGSSNKLMRFINSDAKALTLYHIANSVFILESLIKHNKPFPKKVSINYFCELTNREIERLSYLLNTIINEVLLENIEFKFVKSEFKKKKLKLTFDKLDTLCLYSGGVDSTIGIIKTKEKYNDILGVYVSHKDTGRITSIVRKLCDNLLKPKDIQVRKLIAPGMGKEYSQTRGFLYVLYAGIISIFTTSNRLIISECGATMYQPKFSPLDTVTYTTNPYVLMTAKSIIQIILKKEFEIITPFEDFTKTELMSLLQDDTILSQTHSCITGRWGINCGKCYACITRMIGSINLDLGINYFKNFFLESYNDNLVSLLNFCTAYLYHKNEVDYWSLNLIRTFNKEDLFNRVCYDTFLAMFLLNEKKLLDEHIRLFLFNFLKNSKGKLEQRKKELTLIKPPDFNKSVN